LLAVIDVVPSVTWRDAPKVQNVIVSVVPAGSVDVERV
jgi:hypothetical protein